MDLDVMQAIADITGGNSYQALDRRQLQHIYQDIAEHEPEKFESLSYRPRQDLFYYPVAVIVTGYMLFFTLMTLRASVAMRSGRQRVDRLKAKAHSTVSGHA